MWRLYILLCDDKTYYVGITTNLENRLFQHQNKLSFYTKRFKQMKLVYKEECLSQSDAEKREKQIKKWSRAKKKALIIDNKDRLVSLSNHHGAIS